MKPINLKIHDQAHSLAVIHAFDNSFRIILEMFLVEKKGTFYTLSKWLWSLIHSNKFFQLFFCSSAIFSFCSSVKHDILYNLFEFISKVLFTRKIVSINYFVVQRKSGKPKKIASKNIIKTAYQSTALIDTSSYNIVEIKDKLLASWFNIVNLFTFKVNNTMKNHNAFILTLFAFKIFNSDRQRIKRTVFTER